MGKPDVLMISLDSVYVPDGVPDDIAEAMHTTADQTVACLTDGRMAEAATLGMVQWELFCMAMAVAAKGRTTGNPAHNAEAGCVALWNYYARTRNGLLAYADSNGPCCDCWLMDNGCAGVKGHHGRECDLVLPECTALVEVTGFLLKHVERYCDGA